MTDESVFSNLQGNVSVSIPGASSFNFPSDTLGLMIAIRGYSLAVTKKPLPLVSIKYLDAIALVLKCLHVRNAVLVVGGLGGPPRLRLLRRLRFEKIACQNDIIGILEGSANCYIYYEH